MTLRFAYTQPNGIVAIVIAAPKELLLPLIGTGSPKTLSDADYRAHVIARSIPKTATDVIELKTDQDLPPDRSRRLTWSIKNGKLWY